MTGWRIGAALLVVFAWGAAAAEPERDRIAAERTAARAKFLEQEQACREHFIVASCLEAASKAQRDTLTRLRREELQLDDARRRASGTARAQSNASKAEAQEQRASDAAAASLPEHAHSAPQPNAPVARRSGATGAVRKPADEEQRNEAKFAARAQAAKAHREAVERRNAQREKQGKPVQALPLPEGASAPR